MRKSNGQHTQLDRATRNDAYWVVWMGEISQHGVVMGDGRGCWKLGIAGSVGVRQQIYAMASRLRRAAGGVDAVFRLQPSNEGYDATLPRLAEYPH